MPITTQIVANGVNPSQIVFSVTNAVGGPPLAVRVNVILSWDPAFAQCVQVGAPLGYSLQVGSCTWTSIFIQVGQTRTFTIDLQRIQANPPAPAPPTFVMGTAHNTANNQNPSSNIPLP